MQIAQIMGKLEELKEDGKSSHASISQHIEKVHKQVILTNGRVGKLENWRSYMLGAMAILTLIVVPVFMFLLYSHLS